MRVWKFHGQPADVDKWVALIAGQVAVGDF